MFYVYFLFNSKIDKYYIGYSSNLSSRIEEHNKSFHKTKYTRRQSGMWELVYFEKYQHKSSAIKREREIKSWKSRKKIEMLVEQSR